MNKQDPTLDRVNTLWTGIFFLYINHKSLIQSSHFFLVNHALLPFFVALFIV
jgi:hypothetical protein